MTESPVSPSLRPTTGSKPPPWALAEIQDDSKGQIDRHTSSVSITAGEVNGSPGPKTSSRSSKMAQPSDFGFGKELGSGSWSTVMEATHTTTGKCYAVKILSKSQLIKLKKARYASVEKDSLVKLSGTHPGIVRMHAAFQDETSLYFVLDLAPHGDMADLVKKYGSLSLQCARWYTAQIVDAILWVHSKGIVHRDLKPENVLLDGDLRVKLTDFGSAYISPDGDLSPRASTFVGSAAYVSPELLDRTSKTTSSSSDIWAIGCTLYFMVAGKPAFAAINDYQSFRKIEALDYTFPEGFYDVAQDFVQKLVVLNPSDRLGVEPKSSTSELREHPLFTRSEDSMAPDEPGGTSIRWDTLWTDPPEPPETGIVQPAPTAVIPEDEDVSLWDNVVHEFSLVNINSPGANGTNGTGGQFSPSELLMPSRPSADVPPDVVTTEVAEIVTGGDAGKTSTEGSITPDEVDGDTVTEGAHAPGDGVVGISGDGGELEDVDDPVLKAKDWSSVLAPGEVARAVAAVRTPIRRGLSKQPRPCALLLTAGPRILCVPLDDGDKTARKFEAKHSFVFPKQSQSGNKSPRGDKILTACKTDERRRKLLLQTGEKEYAYEFSSDKALAKWAQEITTFLDAH